MPRLASGSATANARPRFAGAVPSAARVPQTTAAKAAPRPATRSSKAAGRRKKAVTQRSAHAPLQIPLLPLPLPPPPPPPPPLLTLEPSCRPTSPISDLLPPGTMNEARPRPSTAIPTHVRGVRPPPRTDIPPRIDITGGLREQLLGKLRLGDEWDWLQLPEYAHLGSRAEATPEAAEPGPHCHGHQGVPHDAADGLDREASSTPTSPGSSSSRLEHFIRSEMYIL